MYNPTHTNTYHIGMVDQPMLAKRNLIHPYGSLTTAESERLRARSGSNASSQVRV